jgi:RHS repeat-associated protein
MRLKSPEPARSVHTPAFRPVGALGRALLLVLLWLAGRGLAVAQSCPSWTVTGTVSSGDGSVIPGQVEVFGDGCHPDCEVALETANSTSVSFTLSGNVGGNYETAFYAVNGSYFYSPKGGHMSCTQDPNPPFCTTCSGGFSLALYAQSGALEGNVKVLPHSPASLAGIAVWISRPSDPPAGYINTDASGHYEWRATYEPARSNNWGLPVDGDYSPWPHSGMGSKDYRVGVGIDYTDPVDTKVVTVHSSELVTADLVMPADYAHNHEIRCPNNGGGGPSGPGTAVGNPVNVVTGNVYFDQTDIALPGLPGLVFSRSYNSRNAFWNVASTFGRGWTHSYERSLSIPEAQVLAFQGSDGVPIYYQDVNADLTFKAVLPATETSWIVRDSSSGGYTRYLREGGNETYDSAGRLLTVVDASGNTVTLTRDDSGRLTDITDGSGRSLSFTYDENFRIASLSGPAGVVAHYDYDSLGYLRRVSYPDGTGYVFVYDGIGQLLRMEDLTGRPIESHTYDAAGYGLTSETTDGVDKLTLAYERRNGTTTVTDALGNVTTYYWKRMSAMRRVTKIVGGCPSCGGSGGINQEWTYDADGRVLTYTDGAAKTTTYTYDAAGDLATMVDALNDTTSYTHDAQGRVLTVTKPDGGLTTNTYAVAGPLTVTERVTSSVNRTTTMTYNAAGRVATISDPRAKTTTLGYNSAGDLTSVTDPLGHATSFTYDNLGRRITVTDALGHTTTTAYDARGRVLRITNHDGTHTDFAYDGAGRRRSVTDPLGRVTLYAYDPYGRLQTVTDATDGVTAYAYDTMNNLTSLTDANGHATTFDYDEFHRVKKVTYPGGAFETFTYDTAGRLSTRTDRKAVTTTYGYDDLGRLTGKAYSDSTPAVSYTCDTMGRLLTAANGTDTLTWTYDLAGQLLSEQSNYNSSTVGYTYDSGGNRLSVSLNGTLFVSYSYDDTSRLTTITRGSDNFGFGYDDANRRTSMTYPNGIATAYTYDNLNRLTRLKADLGPIPVTDFQYTYDSAGNRTRKHQLDYTEDYSYDALYRLTGVDRSAGLTGISRYGYDAVGNRVTNQINDAVLTSTYNEKNQLTSSAGGGTLRVRGMLDKPGHAKVNGDPARMLAGNVFEAAIQATPGTNTFTVEATDQSGNVTTKNYQVNVSGSDATYTYDLNGNLTQKVDGADTWIYTWDPENRLTQVQNNGTTIATFAYDPLGRRVQKVAGDVTTRWTYDGSATLRQVAGATTLKYIQGSGIDEPLAVDDGTALTYYHADGLGSLVKTTSASGAVTLARQYDAWGSLQLGSATPGYAFTGREWDPETGLHYYRARYYDPRIGRFISEDLVHLNKGLSLYTYVRNNPANHWDPLGLQAAGRSGIAQFDYCSFEIMAYPPLNVRMSLVTAPGKNQWDRFLSIEGSMPGCSFTCSKLVGPEGTDPSMRTRQFLTGFSFAYSFFFGPGGGVTRSSGMTSIDPGIGTAGGGPALGWGFCFLCKSEEEKEKERREREFWEWVGRAQRGGN